MSTHHKTKLEIKASIQNQNVSSALNDHFVLSAVKSIQIVHLIVFLSVSFMEDTMLKPLQYHGFKKSGAVPYMAQNPVKGEETMYSLHSMYIQCIHATVGKLTN